LSDTYKPHTSEEAVGLVPPTVAATLKNGEEYGIRWWNRSSQKSRQISEPTQNGQRYYRRKIAYIETQRRVDSDPGPGLPCALARGES
jgi:hypothetical protein